MTALHAPLKQPLVSLNGASGTGIVTGSAVDFGAIYSSFAVLVASANPGSQAAVNIEVSWDGTLFQGVPSDNSVNAQYVIPFPARYVRVDAENLAADESVTAQVIPL